MMKMMVKPSVRNNSIFSLGALFRLRFSFMVVAPLSVLLLVLSAGRGHAINNGVPGTKLGSMVKGSITTTAALSAATSKTITGFLMKIPQGNAALSAVLSAGTLLFSADQVEALDGACYSTNYYNTECGDLTWNGCEYSQDDNDLSKDCCSVGEQPCEYSSYSAFGCCSCNRNYACNNSPNCVFYDNSCNGVKACNHMYGNSVVYSSSCNNQKSCAYSQLTVGSGSCNGEASCGNCCGFNNNPCPNGENIVIPDNTCNDDSSSYNTENPNPTCGWCPNCLNSDVTSCYNSQLTGEATLIRPGYYRTLQMKKSKQKDKTSKKTPMSCESAKNKIVSYFQKQSVTKLRSKYTSGKVANSSKQGGERKRTSRDCHVELSWLYEHLEEDELVQACAELEAHTAKLQAYLGKGWTIQNLKCIPEDKNKIN